jgi:hypothetical protein
MWDPLSMFFQVQGVLTEWIVNLGIIINPL